MPYTEYRRLSDGTKMQVEIIFSISGTYFYERHSPKVRKRQGVLWLLGEHMHLLLADGSPVRVTNPEYSTARDARHGSELALKFFIDSMESVIKKAKEEGIPIARMYD